MVRFFWVVEGCICGWVPSLVKHGLCYILGRAGGRVLRRSRSFDECRARGTLLLFHVEQKGDAGIELRLLVQSSNTAGRDLLEMLTFVRTPS